MLKRPNSSAVPDQKHRDRSARNFRFKGLPPAVRPGITGYGQVGGRQEVSYEKRVKMDVYCIQNWSLWYDSKILCLTVWKVLKREEAY
jgi:lipopolysaccharide/colanic/teichoic acid biosynthesis glycosyltransferase